MDISTIYISEVVLMADKSLAAGSTPLLLLKLLEEKDMYGYEMIEALASRSDHTFDLKAGTLYPLLHDLEKQGALESYDAEAGGKRMRRYYSLTKEGRRLLAQKQSEWEEFSRAVNLVLQGGASLALA